MYGDFRREGVKQAEAKDGITRMMYNHTCDIADEMGIDDRWLRTCPPGVRSCFWAEARYDKQGNILNEIQMQKKNIFFFLCENSKLIYFIISLVPLFRGCANATFAHDQRCSRELQAVQIIWGKKTVDVEIKLCFCNDDKCNEQANGAFGLIHQQSLQFIFVAIITLIGSLLMNESMLLNEKYYTGRIE